MNSRRAEGFSDNVFAVAITILVFNLLPIGAGRYLTGAELVRGWPSYAAYVVSFFTIGITWTQHHSLFARITTVDRPLLMLNLLLLMGIVAVPFPTALVAEHLKVVGGHGENYAIVAYGINGILISTSFSFMWLYLARHAAKLGDSAPPLRWTSALRFNIGIAGYVTGTIIGVCVVPHGYALIVFGLIPIYYAFEHLPDIQEEASRLAQAIVMRLRRRHPARWPDDGLPAKPAVSSWT
jgi:uncharacterized membrane protein